ncbi:MAG: helix-turn-helix domain-containing protein [Clostridiales bacterium]|nr:helix-turn-helix domain-containing protein [Clostridiales bacterium]
MFKVLIIDDEMPIHVALQSLIDWENLHAHEPYSAYNGKEALELMERLNPDIVFVDMNMPVMNGKDFLASASGLYPESQFIVISGYDDFEYAHAAIKYNVVDYLLKPLDRDEIMKALKVAIDRLPEDSLDANELTPTEIIATVRDYIDRNYQRDISIKELTDKFYFSKEYLSRLFREEYGCPIYEYVLKVRLEKAREYLMNPNMQIQEISDKLGYSNANYFGKAFRRRYGVTPSEFRKALPNDKN